MVSNRRDLACAVALAVLAIVIYLPCLRGGFIWDDGSMITSNPLVQSPEGWKAAWTGSAGRDYLPVTFSMLWVEWRAGKGSPVGFHAVNILLHALNTLLLWRLLKALQVPGAWLGALLFAVHPVNAASVAWMAERKNTLSLAFSLGAMLAYLRADRRGSAGDYGMALIIYALALLSKPAAVVVAPGLLLCAWWRKGSVNFRDLAKSSPFFVLALVAGLVTIWFQHHRAIGGEEIPMGGWLARLATAGQAWWFSVGKLLFPRGLSMLYPPWKVGQTLPWGVLPAVAVGAVLGTAWVFRARGARPVFFALAWYTLALLPVLGFVRMYYFRFSPVADHWQYFAAPSVLALVGAGVHWVMVRHRFAGWTLALAAVVVLSAQTWRRAATFQSPELFWREVRRGNPSSWPASSNLAILFLQQGRPGEALAAARAAVQFAPGVVETRLNLAVILDETGDNVGARAEFSEAVRLRPDLPQTHRGLGTALERGGLSVEAAAAYREALRLDPTDGKTRFKLGNLELAAGAHEEAARQFREILRLRPDDLEARNCLAVALFLTGKREEAIHEFREILRLDPEHSGAEANLKRALGTQP